MTVDKFNSLYGSIKPKDVEIKTAEGREYERVKCDVRYGVAYHVSKRIKFALWANNTNEPWTIY